MITINCSFDLFIISARKIYELGLLKNVLIGSIIININQFLIDNNWSKFIEHINKNNMPVKSIQIACNMAKMDIMMCNIVEGIFDREIGFYY